jgi:hypothetical protein
MLNQTVNYFSSWNKEIVDCKLHKTS